MTQTYDPNSLPDLLPIYYKKLFPYNSYYKWLSYGGDPKTYFTQREFSFTLKDDIYIRYLSFSDQVEMEKEIQKRCPYKIDIGAVFSHRPKDHKTVKSTAFQAKEKELVFDIDMTDYDEVRTCCSGADICPKCWPLMVIAIKIMDKALRDDFGFEHLLWVYSGRRGIHCWVCDPSARALTHNARSAVAEYLSVIKGGENQTRKVTLYEGNVHPSVQRALKIVSEHFKDYAIKKQDFLSNEDRLKKVVSLVPEPDFQSLILEKAEKLSSTSTTSKHRWMLLKELVQDHAMMTYKKCSLVLEEIMLQYCYPRLDVNVSTGVNHLLKSPFCVHPKTGRICVPIDPDNAENFDPFTVPTISELCDELNQKDSGSDSKPKTRDVRQTSLGQPLAVFERFVKKLERTWKTKLIEESDKKMEF